MDEIQYHQTVAQWHEYIKWLLSHPPPPPHAAEIEDNDPPF